MSCNGHCPDACCSYPFGFVQTMHKQMNMGQLPTFPTFPPVIPSELTPCVQWNGAPGWSTDEAGECFPYPGAPGFPQTPMPSPAPTGPFPTIPGGPLPPGGTGPFPTLPGGQPVPIPPGVPAPPGGVPGLVSEQEAQAREAAAADAARAKEESKMIKYAVITAVVGGVVGLAIGKVF